MKKSRFTESQIVDALKRVQSGLGVPDLCREMGISTATFYKWRAKYGGMDTSLMALIKLLGLRGLLEKNKPINKSHRATQTRSTDRILGLEMNISGTTTYNPPLTHKILIREL